MRVFRDIGSIRTYLLSLKGRSRSIGLVPTMGALHRGHLSLVQKARSENDVTVCSIYVNPTQFNNHNDLANYPRNIEQDLQLLKREGCQVVFQPDDEQMYPDVPPISIDMAYLDSVLEGLHRPGHFRGVRLIVAKLLNITDPDRAYFGAKDLQQLVVIRQMAEALNYGTEIIGVDTVREADGLAMSSRNLLLTTAERTQAPAFYDRLVFARREYLKNKPLDEIRADVYQYFEAPAEPRLEYFEFVDSHTFKVADNNNSAKNVSICIAGYVGNIRLIDNISV